MRLRRFCLIAACVGASLVLSWLADGLADRLAAAFADFAREIRIAVGLLLVACVGLFCLRPMFLAYSRAGEDGSSR